MDMEIDVVRQLLDEVVSDDLEGCEKALRAGDSDAALACLEQAFARLSAAQDTLRDLPRQPHDLGLTSVQL
jgi:hypothetical protein